MGDQFSVKVKSLVAVLGLVALAGCRQDMHDQPKFYPQRGTTLFADGRSVRPQVENTVARGQLHEDNYFETGMANGAEGYDDAFSGYDGRSRARPGALQHLLHAVPLSRGQRRRWHGVQ